MTVRKPTEERRREIAAAAIKIIGERGLREFTAAQLAEEVGIKDATIFRHFKDMNEVKEAALDRLQGLVDAAPDPMAANPLTRLEHFVRLRLHAVSVQPGIQSLIFSDQLSHALGDEGPRRIAELRNRGRDFVRSCLQDAAQQGLIREDTDIESAVLLITGMAMGFLFAAKDGAVTAPVTEVEERCWQTVRVMLEPREVKP
ncbi:MAG: TetR/AcrR family transcriptional regulator [Myxococcales bacterium]|nr:TetR/AcrR family transcriptional regulator [Myxococcales bacterium]MCB9576639.1 TetR/AcrR family transcriptional regulator [Polyangiaceae bacterium]